MTVVAYRLKNPATVVIRQANRYRLVPAGSVFKPLGSKSDSNTGHSTSDPAWIRLQFYESQEDGL